MNDLPNVPGAPPPATPEPLLVGMDEAARLLGVSDRTVWSMTNAGELPHVRIRRRVLFPLAELREWIARNMEGGDR